MKHIFLSVALLVTLWGLSTVAALAQGPGSGGPIPGAAPTAVPIDGGVSLLLAGGVAFGLKQLRTHRQVRKSTK